LHTGNGHGEASLSTTGVKGKLVGDIVVVVTEVPEKKENDEAKIDSSLLFDFGGGCPSTDGKTIRCFCSESLVVVFIDSVHLIFRFGNK
jgi:hypothetical protein